MKKKFLTLLFMFFCSLSFCQNYKFGAISSSSVTAKSEGTINITDKNVSIESEGKIFNYDLVKNVNRIIYFTDGVMTHFFTVTEQKGSKKGFDYNYMINYQMDKNLGGTSVIYWCKKIE